MTNARFKTENLIKTKIICFPKMQPNTDFSGGDKLYINHLSDTNIKLGWNVWYAGEDNDIKILNNFFDLKNVKYKIKDQEIIDAKPLATFFNIDLRLLLTLSNLY